MWTQTKHTKSVTQAILFSLLTVVLAAGISGNALSQPMDGMGGGPGKGGPSLYDVPWIDWAQMTGVSQKQVDKIKEIVLPV